MYEGAYSYKWFKYDDNYTYWKLYQGKDADLVE